MTAVFDQLEKEDPNNPVDRNNATVLYQNWTALHAALGQLDKAEETVQRLVTWSQAATDEIRSPENLAKLAKACDALGAVRQSRNHDPEAIHAYQSAIDISTQLVSDHPDNVDWRVSLWRSQWNLVLALRDRGDYERALSVSESAMKDEWPDRLPALVAAAAFESVRSFGVSCRWDNGHTMVIEWLHLGITRI